MHLLQVPAGGELAAGDTGRSGYKARYLLAQVYRRQERYAEAMAEWRAIIEEQPRFLPARDALADLCRAQAQSGAIGQPAPARSPEAVCSIETATRIESMSWDEFRVQFGSPELSGALSGYTRADDTKAVLTILCHARPRRVLEVGTALGHMTANLTRWTPDDALVFTLDLVRDVARLAPGAAEQEVEVRPRSERGRLANHFGTGHKLLFVTADSLTYDFGRLAPLEFAFIDGGHDLEHVLNDSRKAYEALTPGGWLVWHDFDSPQPWIKVRQAIETIGFAEPVMHVEGTEVAFLKKAEPATVGR